jgi:hypothetical protein
MIHAQYVPENMQVVRLFVIEHTHLSTSDVKWLQLTTMLRNLLKIVDRTANHILVYVKI